MKCPGCRHLKKCRQQGLFSNALDKFSHRRYSSGCYFSPVDIDHFSAWSCAHNTISNSSFAGFNLQSVLNIIFSKRKEPQRIILMKLCGSPRPLRSSRFVFNDALKDLCKRKKSCH
jgi:hypothetical protein